MVGAEPSAPLLLADWGTSNRRAWLIGDGGERLATFADDRGMATIAAGGWPAAYAEMLDALGGIRPRLAVLAGMVGSRRGWSEAPYRRCPAGLDEIAAHLHWAVPREVAIVPGLCQLDPAPDVMRGEEVQALGAAACGLVPDDALTCHPGTHTKWVRLQGGTIRGFGTAMTGELFALLREHSILADCLGDGVEPGAAFLEGVDRGFAGADLPVELFRVRARTLLGLGPDAPASYVSGMLVGADLRFGLERAETPQVHVIGRSDLTRLYAAAIAHRGLRAVTVDGAQAALAGLVKVAEQVA